ncbi:ScbR family autoregulator-binding transcription factor [Streptomyces caniscabiei]|uniref:TetR/AcrR family transcriptional regulator n=1 Tax=Streptomyces caniscabiei TaxID=2746961 RepID=A0A927LCF1_9ACTN|nr:ScbR family autoregulator-binding transcription factor [Streptomyces caniscabiei]MBD9704642.1 TetR/AcrR family transcriptional regulator [Streptomyces caniscabiei]MBD9729370.1 TetR/AcrR family transcriptional regulator [Streptomyces caniscabiei]MDX3515036.1 ScbR family autoregulator-binding transcription factor [Streptomyces caniscabiei]MDX3724344.1 ScbR family autoregulator-binding transcription factor [Streptomyces caniscabiei]MDX3733769.1 ScbR family autoregulator-binding transcription f
MARQERAVRTRHAVIRAAAEVFAERGYAAATIAEILDRAGVTKGALYFHFDSKEALARGVIEAQITGDSHVPCELKLQEWVDVGMVLAYQIPRDAVLLAGIRLSADLHSRRLFGSAWPAWIELSTTYLGLAKDRGEVLPHVVPKETAECFLGAWLGTQMFSEATSNWSDLSERVSVLFNHMLPAIATPAALIRLDTAPDRGARVIKNAERLRQTGSELEHAEV